ncbi:hypothetical protein MAPG_03854 [Magnaporthiopsis poae ATCC 64411]|uniref:Uncharacterized protein n=1 Tax=Magnaporthiopsis poae (strain ATCC 64411 / 73-15) TaxID=644358 RepID=A0A0C4DV54_MAGP6|nr:hypothetical protein MAPG_03854 [Magnaporthiopsis poae ATCC 64411]
MPSLKQTVIFLPLAALAVARPITVHVSPTSPTSPTSPIFPDTQDAADAESIATILQRGILLHDTKREENHRNHASYTQNLLTRGAALVQRHSLAPRAEGDKQKGGGLRVITQLGGQPADAVSPPNSPEAGEGQNKYTLAVSPLSPAENIKANPFDPKTDSKKYWEYASKQAKAMKQKEEAERMSKLEAAGKRPDPARKEQLEAQKKKQLETERVRPKLNLMDQAWRKRIDQANGQEKQGAAIKSPQVDANKKEKATKS